MRGQLTTTALAGVLLAAAGAVGVFATPAQAAPVPVDCTVIPNNADAATGQTTKDNVPVHKGPYGACTVLGYIGPRNTGVRYDCFVWNSYGNTWTHITGMGWVYDQYLDDGGSTEPCDDQPSS
jgi:hypothetical protein